MVDSVLQRFIYGCRIGAANMPKPFGRVTVEFLKHAAIAEYVLIAILIAIISLVIFMTFYSKMI